MEQRIGECGRIGEILGLPRHTGDRMIGRQRPDHAAQVAELGFRGGDAEQAAILLHQVDSGAPVCGIDHQVHGAVRRKHAAQRSKAKIGVGQVMEHTGTDDLVEHLVEFPDRFDRQLMKIEVSQAVFSLKIARMA